MEQIERERRRGELRVERRREEKSGQMRAGMRAKTEDTEDRT